MLSRTRARCCLPLMFNHDYVKKKYDQTFSEAPEVCSGGSTLRQGHGCTSFLSWIWWKRGEGAAGGDGRERQRRVYNPWNGPGIAFQCPEKFKVRRTTAYSACCGLIFPACLPSASEPITRFWLLSCSMLTLACCSIYPEKILES